MVDARLDAIIHSHTKTPRIIKTERDMIRPTWGFVPRNLEKQTFAKIAADERLHPKFYDDPLKDFEHKLINAARKWAKHHDLDFGRVLPYLEKEVWPKLRYKSGKLKFTCTMIPTESPNLRAWRLDWTGPKADRPQVATKEKGDNDLIDVFPAIAVLILNENIYEKEKSYSTRIYLQELLEGTSHVTFMDSHPFCLISKTVDIENSIHLPISFVMDTLAIALDIQTGRCVLKSNNPSYEG